MTTQDVPIGVLLRTLCVTAGALATALDDLAAQGREHGVSANDLASTAFPVYAYAVDAGFIARETVQPLLDAVADDREGAFEFVGLLANLIRQADA